MNKFHKKDFLDFIVEYDDLITEMDVFYDHFKLIKEPSSDGNRKNKYYDTTVIDKVVATLCTDKLVTGATKYASNKIYWMNVDGLKEKGENYLNSFNSSIPVKETTQIINNYFHDTKYVQQNNGNASNNTQNNIEYTINDYKENITKLDNLFNNSGLADYSNAGEWDNTMNELYNLPDESITSKKEKASLLLEKAKKIITSTGELTKNISGIWLLIDKISEFIPNIF
ncbi:hypothetical protein CNY62_00830 [Brochothrix thermosphacta]|uniref:Uncharacterized protein n=1 Tax=Brochothrix thermosphacta TaxID=2756 RepID=A0A291BUU5_BROTH|nr:hypothetical protein [Brochothrix thermosphacta]ATF25035.1 hypothetical protein CNY62_00830 [Brochothrix thermosphacta]